MKFGTTQLTDEQLDNVQRACRGKRFAIVAARFHNPIAEKLIDGARRGLIASGVTRGEIDVYDVPGAFELPLAARTLILRREHRDPRFALRNSRQGRPAKPTPPRVYAGIVVVGAVIRGETPHFDFVAGECARGIMNVQLETGVPIGFGVLTTDTLEQAELRAAADGGDKGYESALAVAAILALRYSEAIQHAKTHTQNGAIQSDLSEEEVNDSYEAETQHEANDNSGEPSLDRCDAGESDSKDFESISEETEKTDIQEERENEPAEPKVLEDKTLICRDCSKEFIFAIDEQQFFAEKGFQNEPQRCRDCRQTRRTTARASQHLETIVCADCGVTSTVPFRPRNDRPVYCRTCYLNHTTEPATAVESKHTPATPTEVTNAAISTEVTDAATLTEVMIEATIAEAEHPPHAPSLSS